MPGTEINPDIIGQVPIATEAGDGSGTIIIGDAPTELERLREEYAALQAELEEERGRNDPNFIRAKMMKPYADKTFWFVCGYCVVTVGMLCVSAAREDFNIPVAVQSIIAGSTAVAAIGLVNSVLSGLFKPGGRSD